MKWTTVWLKGVLPFFYKSDVKIGSCIAENMFFFMYNREIQIFINEKTMFSIHLRGILCKYLFAMAHILTRK